MHRTSIRVWIVSLTCALGLLAATAGVADAQRQRGLVNVNIEDLQLQVPVSVNVPVGLAVNACGINVLAIADQDFQCTATNNTRGLSRAIAHATLYPAVAGQRTAASASRQSGLVNVNIEGLQLQLPISVNLAIGAAANVCGINVAAIADQGFRCDAMNKTQGLSAALAKAFWRQRG